MRYLTTLAIFCFLLSCKNNTQEKKQATSSTTSSVNKKLSVTGGVRETVLDPITQDTLIYPEEVHLKNIRQVTFGGDNAEAYWSFDDKQLVFQSNYKNWDVGCDQMFLMDAQQTFKHTKPPMISTGMGRTTCAYFLPDNKHYVYGSTHLVDENCPEVPLRKNGNYVWPVYDSFDIFVADLQGNITAQLTTEPGYDAEATVSPMGDKIVFTSTRSGDLELYTMNIDGSDVKQITNELGYDGGAFFSPDGTKSITSGSIIYNPALIRLENASSSFGFSLNLEIYPSERPDSMAPWWSFERPTIPNSVGSSTSQSPNEPMPPFLLCNSSSFPTSNDEIISPLKQANVPLTLSLQLPSAPPVPSGSFSLTIFTSKSHSIESK